MQFDDVSFWSVEDGFQLVILIRIARAEASAALAGYRVGQPFLCGADEGSLEGIERVELESLGEAGPGGAIVSQNDLLGLGFDGSRTGLVHVELHFGGGIGGAQWRCAYRNKHDHCCHRVAGEPHGCAPILRSLPMTTPDAAEIVVAPGASI